MKTKIVNVNEDPRIIAALAALGRPALGDYVLTAPLVRAKPDGRLPRGWRSRAGMKAGGVVQVKRSYSGRDEDLPGSWGVDFELPGTYGYYDAALSVWVPREGAAPRVVRCPSIKEDVDDIEFAVTLLTSLRLREGARGMLSRIEVGKDNWTYELVRLIKLGLVTEAQVREAHEAERAHADDDGDTF